MTSDTDRLPFFHRCPKCRSIMIAGGICPEPVKHYVKDMMTCLTCGWNNEQFFFFDAVKQVHVEVVKP